MTQNVPRWATAAWRGKAAAGFVSASVSKEGQAGPPKNYGRDMYSLISRGRCHAARASALELRECRQISHYCRLGIGYKQAIYQSPGISRSISPIYMTDLDSGFRRKDETRLLTTPPRGNPLFPPKRGARTGARAVWAFDGRAIRSINSRCDCPCSRRSSG